MSNSFVKLLVSQLFANLADIFFRVTIIANIYIISKSVIATSLVPILIGISSFVASLLVPLVTKRLALNRVLSLSQFGKTILLAILVGMFTVMQSVAPLVTYLFVVAISILDGFAAPVSYAIVPRYATDLGKANSALSMTGEAVQLIGWGLGGLLFATIGLLPTTFIILVLYIISSFLMLFLPNAEVEVLESETNLEILLKGWKLVARNPRLRLFVSANLLEIFSNTIWVSSIILVFVTELLNKTESYWGYSNTAYSIGIIISGLIAFRLSEKFLAAKWESILFTLVAMAIVTLTILYFPNVQMFLLFSALVGMLSQLKEVPESVFLQETVEENHLVNVYSVLEVISTLAFSVFVLLMSYITESFGISISFWLSAICLMIEAILIYIRRDYFK
ncbi:ryptide export MFS transporter [Streptococcus pneumoniae]|uniref:ryptide export MFS transporter n=1 Tax=Streptococcus pneumoniae TaxID=1313 RepID=UPI0005E4B78A|nr:ryptide export MFS transporter [Streptococcus pneumoniae]CGG36587.1 transporter major facilitator family protein [Streptococcus pneumoniae]CJQ11609.1 transporter major facilitator family protein [Streptococcus pneumoniae]CJX58219.1 transporter major facilitator family protein [Streptococcus pneumoniae]